MSNQTQNLESPLLTHPSLDRNELEKYLRLIYETRDSREALEYVERAIELAPDDPRVRQSLYGTLLALTDRDPFIGYVAETEKNYIITFRKSRPFVVPKDRRDAEIFPPTIRTEGERILRFLRWAVLGLIPAGLGAVVVLPIVFLRATSLLSNPSASGRDQRLAVVGLLLSSALACLGMFLFGLLLLHWIG